MPTGGILEAATGGKPFGREAWIVAATFLLLAYAAWVRGGTAVRYQAPPHTHFIIKSGPQTASGDEWWELQDVDDPTRGGWASRRYLQSLTTP